jgi:peptidyl-prolyl cis-trans isomerase D
MAKQRTTPKVVTKKHIARLERERRQVKIIRAIAIAGILIVAGLLGYGYLKLNFLLLREPVAEVNGVKITTGEWQERVRLERVNKYNLLNRYQFFQQNFGMDTSQQQQQILTALQSPEIMGQQVLDQMIDDILVRQEAEKRGMTVSADDVEKSIQEAYDFFPDGTPTPTITPSAVSSPTLTSQQLTIYPPTSTPTQAPTPTLEATATLDLSATPAPTSGGPTPTPVPELPTATATPYTLEGFKTKYQETITNLKSYNISDKTLRSVYEVQLLRQKLMDEITKDTPRTEEQVWARHILVDNLGTAKTVEALLAHGADFAETAKKFSKDTGSAEKGGDLGWFGTGAMVAEFDKAAFSQKIGEIGEPVKSQFGYHIIQVIARQENPLDATQYDQKKQTAFTDWLAGIRKEAKITTYDVWKERVPTEPTFEAQQ